MPCVVFTETRLCLGNMKKGATGYSCVGRCSTLCTVPLRASGRTNFLNFQLLAVGGLAFWGPSCFQPAVDAGW